MVRIISVLSRRQAQLLTVLLHTGTPMTVGELAKVLFAGDAAGGPDWADGVVTTAVARLRKKIAQHHLQVRVWNAPAGGYRAELLE